MMKNGSKGEENKNINIPVKKITTLGDGTRRDFRHFSNARERQLAGGQAIRVRASAIAFYGRKQ